MLVTATSSATTFSIPFADIDSLETYAGVHARVWGFHRMLARRFPYAIYYKVEGDVCVIWRVLDCRRSPNRLRRDLTRSK
jgi:hypothetical protein